jgi:hypothetical protein
MKNLKITESCLVKGEHAETGTVLKNVDNALAAELVTNGRAVEIAAKPEVLNHRDPEPENRDLKSSKKAKDAPAE